MQGFKNKNIVSIARWKRQDKEKDRREKGRTCH